MVYECNSFLPNMLNITIFQYFSTCLSLSMLQVQNIISGIYIYSFHEIVVILGDCCHLYLCFLPVAFIYVFVLCNNIS
jgi:hypothetical protein